MTGRFTGSVVLYIRSPLYKTKILYFFNSILRHLILITFYGPKIYDHFPTMIDDTVAGLVSPPHYMYIYSLRAFLTTKGALIDGD